MEDNQLVLAFRQLIKLIIDADKDLTELINSKASSWDSSVEELISKITAEEQYRSTADEELEEKIYNLITSLNTEIAERQTGISDLNKKLNTSVHKLETSDTELKTALDEESATRLEEDQKLLDLINAHVTALVSEIAERKESDNALNAKIESEAATRSNADSELTEAIANEASLRESNDQSLDNKITNEASLRAASDTDLQNKITAEISARESAIAGVQGSIESETTARTEADADLQEQINTNKTNLESEASTRAAKDAELATAISKEEEARIESDTSLLNSLNNEISERKSADSTLQTNITNETNARVSAVAALQQSLSDEQTARADADSDLQDSITAEQNARTESDSNLQEQISLNKTNLESEASTRASKDTALENAIAKEVSDRQTAISNESSARSEAIANEQTTRASEDAKLQQQITTNKNNISSEATTRADSDSNLQSLISSEQTARSTADSNLQSSITTEQNTRANEDSKLQQQINANKTSIESETTARTEADSNLQNLITAEQTARTSEDAKLQQQINANKAEVDQLVVDSLTSSDTNKALSANQGRVLNNTFKNYYDKAEVDQLVVDTQAIFYGDGADSSIVPIDADLLEGHPASYFIDVDLNLQDSIAAEQTARTEAINTLTARMNTFTSLPGGSTTGDAELIDIRVGANGTTYPNAGGAVRGQISELKGDLVDVQDKLGYTKSNNLVGTSINKFYEVNTNISLYLTASTKSGNVPVIDANLIFYDESFSEVGSYNFGASKPNPYVMQLATNYKYMRWSADTSADPRQVEYGQIATPYKDYYSLNVLNYLNDTVSTISKNGNKNLVGIDIDKYYRIDDTKSFITFSTKSGKKPIIDCDLMLYNSNFENVGSYSFGSTDNAERTVPISSESGWYYMKWSVDTSSDPRQVEYGAKATPYFDYNSYVNQSVIDYVNNKAEQQYFVLNKVMNSYVSNDGNNNCLDISTLSGKTWNAVGDSLTEGYYGEDAELYVAKVSKYLGLTVSNYGEGGTTLAINNTGEYQNFSIVERICGLNGNEPIPDADIWTIFGGYNDPYYNSDLGNIDSTELTTVYGALKRIATEIQGRANNPHLIFITPLQSNRNSKYMNDVRNAMIEIGEMYGIPVLDLYKNGGISQINLMRLTHDGVHPTPQGTNMFWKKIAKFMENSL